jgi:hypothetical protein
MTFILGGCLYEDGNLMDSLVSFPGRDSGVLVVLTRGFPSQRIGLPVFSRAAAHQCCDDVCMALGSIVPHVRG